MAGGAALPAMTRSGGPRRRGQAKVPEDDRVEKRRPQHVGQGVLWCPERTLNGEKWTLGGPEVLNRKVVPG